MKSVLLLGQIMFYLRIFNFQAQLGTRDIQKFDFKKVLFTSKKLKFMILDRLPKQPTIPYREIQGRVIWRYARAQKFAHISYGLLHKHP